jgi:hypothetical protein
LIDVGRFEGASMQTDPPRQAFSIVVAGQKWKGHLSTALASTFAINLPSSLFLPLFPLFHHAF